MEYVGQLLQPSVWLFYGSYLVSNFSIARKSDRAKIYKHHVNDAGILHLHSWMEDTVW